MRKSKIYLDDLTFHAYHGYGAQERKVGNTFRVDLELTTDLFAAAVSDDLTDTINYAEVYDIVRQEMEVPSALLEHLAGRIIDRLLVHFPTLSAVKVKVYKIVPPIPGEIGRVGVELWKERSV